MTLHKNFINGEWADGKATRENINPSDITDIVGTYAQADEAQTDQAIAAARAAAPGWQAATPQQRADALEFVGAELLAILALTHHTKLLAGWIRRDSEVHRSGGLDHGLNGTWASR